MSAVSGRAVATEKSSREDTDGHSFRQSTTASGLKSLLARFGWLAMLIALLLAAEIGLRVPAITSMLPDPTPRLWHALLVQDKLDYLATMADGQGVDVLFVGNSTTQAGINPEIFDRVRMANLDGQTDSQSEDGRSAGSFNAAIEGLPPFGIEMFLPIFLKRVQPELIIYGLSAQDLNSGSPWAMDITERVNHSPLALAESGRGLRSRFLAGLLNVSQLYRYRPILLQTILSGTKQETHLEEVYFDEQGHDAIAHSLAEIAPEDRGYLYNNAGVLNYAAEGIQVNSLLSIIEQTKDLGIDLVLVNMPLADDYYSNFDRPGDYQNYLETVIGIANEHQVPLWDMENLAANDLTGMEFASREFTDEEFTDEEFADFNHLNAKGAIRLSSLLAELLSNQ